MLYTVYELSIILPYRKLEIAKDTYFMITQYSNINICHINLVAKQKILPNKICQLNQNGRGVCGIIAVLSGKATYTLNDGTECDINAGEIALFSEQISYVLVNKSTIPFSYYTINFSLSHEDSFSSDIILKPKNFEVLIEKIEKLSNCWNIPTPISHIRGTSILYDVIADILDNESFDRIGSKDYCAIAPAVRYITKNFASEITLDVLAQMCNMSITHFRRIFVYIYGISPIQYLLNVRIHSAKEYLIQGSHSITEISHLCGFKDVEYFCRTFKKRTGMTTTEFLASHHLASDCLSTR